MAEKSIEEIKEGIIRVQEHKILLESHPETVRHAIAKTYQPELIKHYYIDELTLTKDKGFIVSLKKRFEPMTEEQYQLEYWPKTTSAFDLKGWINKRISEEKKKKEESSDVGDKASKGGKIKSLYDVLEYINQHDEE